MGAEHFYLSCVARLHMHQLFIQRNLGDSYCYPLRFVCSTSWVIALILIPPTLGTGVSLFGGLDQPTTGPTIPVTYYSVLLDGTPTTNYNNSSASPPDYTNSVLASFSNLTFGQHTIELVLNNPQDISNGSIQLHFDRAVITSGVPTAFWDEQNPG